MTVGIAVLCENSRSAVVIADRLVGFGVPGTQTTLGMDTDCVKLTVLAPGVIAVFSGDKNLEAPVLNRLGDLSQMDPRRLATRLRSACAKVIELEADAKLRAFGLRLNHLRTQALEPPALNLILSTVGSTRPKVTFLIAARDAQEACLHIVNDQDANCCKDPGFTAIGSGSTFSLPILAARRIHKGIDVEEAIYAAYEAKRISEEVGNVGRQTDMAIVSVGKPARRLSEEAIEGLEEIYQSRLALRRADKNAIRRLLGP